MRIHARLLTRSLTHVAAIALIALSAEPCNAAVQQPGTCTPRWQSTFGGAPGTDGLIASLQVWNDGTGAELYAAGRFQAAGGALASNVAKWNGSRWSALGGGVDALASELAVFDDGNGAALYVGGHFMTAEGLPASKIAKWDGASWTALGSGLDGHLSSVQAMLAFDDGSGSALYVAGVFESAGGSSGSHIAKWDGSNWASVGNGLPASVSELCVFNDGNGDKLYAAGAFDFGGGAPTTGLAVWDGSSWTPAAGTAGNTVWYMTVFDDGAGPKLIGAGIFTLPGSTEETRIAQWDGATWSSLGSGVITGSPYTVEAFDDGSGSALFFSGQSLEIPGLPDQVGVAKWDGVTWTAPGVLPVKRVLDFEPFDDGSGVSLFGGQNSTSIGELTTNYIVKWGGTEWDAINTGLSREVTALGVFDDGNGTALFAGGRILPVGAPYPHNIARWDGTSWSQVGLGFSGRPETLTIFDDGTGDALFVGGAIYTLIGVALGPVGHVIKWDGTNWSTLALGVSSTVHASTVFNDGGGDALYVGGQFQFSDTFPVARVARWDGSNWSALGSGMDDEVWALTTFDDGTGTALYAGGEFVTAGGVAVHYIAKWDGTSWTSLGNGMSNPVNALTVFDDGTGPALYAGSNFTIGSNPQRVIMKWDGSNWTALGGGIEGKVTTLSVFDDGSGSALYAGGWFTSAGGAPAQNLAKWDGSNWTPLGSGVNDRVLALTTFDDGNGNALFAGGYFESAPDSSDSFLAKWGCPSSFAIDLCNGDGGNQLGCTNCPCMNNATAGTIGGCLNSAGSSSRIEVTGDPSVSLPAGSAADLRFTMTNGPSSSTSLLFSGAASAPSNPANPCFGQQSGIQAVGRDGLRCVLQGLARHGNRQTDSSGQIQNSSGPHRVWGGESHPTAGLAGQAGFVAGQTRYFQAIHRDDPALVCMRGINSSQAIEITFTP